MNNFKTEQESFWAGSFGDEYTKRNSGKNWLAANTSFFAKVLESAKSVNSVIEFGCNRGLNLQALQILLPEAELHGVEINESAAKVASEKLGIKISNSSIFDYKTEKKFDLALIKGVLIHINPDMLPATYDSLYQSSNKFICIAEYYNPSPVTISYRGHDNKLFKRDFAGEIMDRYPDLKLVDYGFVYHRDPLFPQDDINWFLLKKGE